MRELTGKDQILFAEGAGPASRLVALLAVVGAAPRATAEAWTVAAWEEELLELRLRVVGPAVHAALTCPTCGEGMGLTFDVRDLPRKRRPPSDTPPPLAPLTVADLLALEDSAATGEDALAVLLAAAAGTSRPAAAERLRGPERAALLEALESLSAGLGIELATSCVTCESSFTAPFDVALFVDSELGLRAARLLGDVHVIASTYHWSEAEILGLPVSRRQDYLDRILTQLPLPDATGLGLTAAAW